MSYALDASGLRRILYFASFMSALLVGDDANDQNLLQRSARH